MNLSKLKKVYLIGIKGSAMTALAEIFVNRGIEVIGSDTQEKFYTDEILKNLKIAYFENFSVENIPQNLDLVVYSSAYNKENPELGFAFKNLAKKIPVLSYAEVLASIFNNKEGIAVCGTHGKTTTSAMTAEIFKQAKKDPMALIGSKVTNWKSSALAGKGKQFVIEADEYQNKLQYYRPRAVILLNVDYDHPDFFKTKKDYLQVFKDFLEKIKKKGIIIYNYDCQASRKILAKLKKESNFKAKSLKIISFGKTKKADYFILKREFQKDLQKVYFQDPKENKKDFSLKLTGWHNALNALSALIMAENFKIDLEVIKKALKNFKSSERRLQLKGEYNGALLFDDYAHHPKEIEVTLKGIRERFSKEKLIVGFHPHTFSRTDKFLKEFAKALSLADQVYIIDIYSSAREKKGKIKVHSRDIVKLINQSLKTNKAFYLPTIEDLAHKIKPKLKAGQVFVSMGAGDVFRVHELLSAKNK